MLCCSCAALALSLNIEQSRTAYRPILGLLTVTALHSALVALTGVPGRRGGRRSWLRLSATHWEAEVAASQAAEWILTIPRISLTGVTHPCMVRSFRRYTAS